MKTPQIIQPFTNMITLISYLPIQCFIYYFSRLRKNTRNGSLWKELRYKRMIIMVYFLSKYNFVIFSFSQFFCFISLFSLFNIICSYLAFHFCPCSFFTIRNPLTPMWLHRVPLSWTISPRSWGATFYTEWTPIWHGARWDSVFDYFFLKK